MGDCGGGGMPTLMWAVAWSAGGAEGGPTEGP